MSTLRRFNRREFLGTAASTAGAGRLVKISEARDSALAQPHYTSPGGNLIPYSRREIFATGAVRTFDGPCLNEIAFPLGGIGTGTVSLGGRGNLRDWEIFNRPNKGGTLPFSFVALWIQEEGSRSITRIVEAPVPPPYRGAHGFSRESAEGLPRFRGARFFGSYPCARIEFVDPALPAEVSLEAFTPFIPLETEESGLPVAIFRYRLESIVAKRVRASLAFSLENPIGYDGVARIPTKRSNVFGKNLNEFVQDGKIQGLRLTSSKYPEDSPQFGSMALVTSAEKTSYLLRWTGGAWWDDFHKWWDEFSATGGFANPGEPAPTSEGNTDIATLVATVDLDSGATRDVAFILAWHFPVRENYWNPQPKYKGKRFRNQYAVRFRDAWSAATYVFDNMSRLEQDTRTFHDSFSRSTLPAAVLDAASSQASIIRTNTCMFVEGRQFFGFEGCNDNGGCCPMNCTHVWNYEQTLAHLFPELERSMRQTDFKTNLHPDGSMAFRTLIPLADELWKHSPAADGQMGCIMKVYREWQLSGDEAWLKDLWPQVRKALEYAWVSWDADRDGVMEGEQHNTYDIEFYGPNSMVGSLYLGALRAGEIMARAVGDIGAAERYRKIFEQGSKKLDAALWNGEYYVQRYDESQHPKYQFGTGCLSDQLLGQWFAMVVGLGYVLPRDHVRKTLDSIYRYNFRRDFTDFPNPQRIYAINDEKGLLLCSWPKGNRPALPFVYSDEVWTGIEYQVAAHLLYEGMLDEGLAIVTGARERYDGLRRNPWNEVECGSHYARAMSSWSLLLALSGYGYSAPGKWIAFAPKVNTKAFRCFYSTGSSWGVFSQKVDSTGQGAQIEVKRGSLEIQELRLKPELNLAGARLSASAAGKSAAADPLLEKEQVRVQFDKLIALKAGDLLQIQFELAR